MGLLQNVIEEAGIAAVSLSSNLEASRLVRPSRAVLIKFPYGSLVGEPNNADLQGKVVLEALQVLKEVNIPGQIRGLPFRWKRD